MLGERFFTFKSKFVAQRMWFIGKLFKHLSLYYSNFLKKFWYHHNLLVTSFIRDLVDVFLSSILRMHQTTRKSGWVVHMVHGFN